MDRHLIAFASHSHSRRASLRTVLREVVRAGAISRAELARRTGLSKQTMSEIVRDLLEEDWLREIGQQRGNVGRSATNYELNRNRAYVWGGDLGGTSLRLAISDLTGHILAECTVPTAVGGGHDIIDQIVDLVRGLVRESGVEMAQVACGALGVPGSYDRQRCRLSLVTNIAGLDAFDFEDALSEAMGMTVFVENDVTLAATGELHRGNKRLTGTFAFLAMGTGVGLGIVSDGQIVRGARGGAGEIAWLPLGGDPFDSRNFRAGTLENAVSSSAIVARYTAMGGSEGTVREIFDRYNAGEDAARRVLEETARMLAVAIVAIHAILDPEVVVFGGSIGTRPELIALVRAQLAGCMETPIGIEASQLGGRAGQFGAIAIAVNHFQETLFEDAAAVAARQDERT
ncbi:ROK family transcriptional regulator [Acuticoccus sp. MNP-M23]|uniref:ROK family transcriptional regulator n=1 Tax=Acuticoccus sp. MNP-M23 TaxID=3072793 RepID=UPI002814BD37|nr:ROK family transcriptional regulator [Acuticoccus sp. MNP-M23]WMS41167.1 ROK family transcriptional regulator [Acuticoccus sp. MNP-M23]